MRDRPACNKCGQSFRPVEESGISLDYCATCNLIWFDKGELEQYCSRNNIVLSTSVSSGVLLSNQCPNCSACLTETGHGGKTYFACQSCGGFLVSSTFIDNELPQKQKQRPLQQLDGPIDFLTLLQCLSPWW